MSSHTKSLSELLVERIRERTPAGRAELRAAGCRELKRVSFCCKRVVRLRILPDDPLPYVIPLDHHAAVIVTAVGETTLKDGSACGMFKYKATALKSADLPRLEYNGFSTHVDREIPQLA